MKSNLKGNPPENNIKLPISNQNKDLLLFRFKKRIKSTKNLPIDDFITILNALVFIFSYKTWNIQVWTSFHKYTEVTCLSSCYHIYIAYRVGSYKELFITWTNVTQNGKYTAGALRELLQKTLFLIRIMFLNLLLEHNIF